MLTLERPPNHLQQATMTDRPKIEERSALAATQRERLGAAVGWINRRVKAVHVCAIALMAMATAVAPSGAQASAEPRADGSVCKRGGVAVGHRGTLEGCRKTPPVPARSKRGRGAPLARAAWFDNYGNWNSGGSIAFIRRWPTSGYYYTASGRAYYVKEWRETWSFNIVTLYEYLYSNGSVFGYNQCQGIGPSGPCYWHGF